MKAIEASAEKSLAAAGSSVDKIQAERKASGDDRTRCQIIEDEIEYGADYARGKNDPGTNAPMLSIDHQQSIDLNVVATLSLTGLNLNTVGADSLAPLSKMTRLKSLWLTAIPFSDLSPVGQLKELGDLTIENCAAVSDLGPISYLDKLASLGLTNMKLVASRSGYRPLQALKNLQIIDLRGSDIQSLSVLPNAKLGTLMLDQQYFGDAELAQIASMYPDLVNLSFRTPLLRDLSPISHMTALSQLLIPSGSYPNIDALRDVRTLTEIHVRDLSTNDVTTLSALPNLSSLVVEAPFRNVSDLTSLQALRGLKNLRAGYAGDLQNLDMLSGFPALESLEFADYGGRIYSVAAIASMPKLVSFTVDYAQIQDISPLYGFLDSRQTAQVALNGVVLPRSQEQMNNTLRDKFGARYTGNVTIQR